MKEATSIAASILAEAQEIVDGSRRTTHGWAERSFQRTADLWRALLGIDVTAVDVALMLALLKVARMQCGEPVRDHFVDAAGYMALAGELENG